MSGYRRLTSSIVGRGAGGLLIIGLSVLAPVVFGAQSQTTSVGERRHVEKGYTPDQLYFAIGGAEVNAFNFNMVVSMSEQVGFAQPVDGGVGVSLNRIYNSKLIDNKTRYTHRQCPIYPEGIRAPFNTFGFLTVPRQNPMGLGWEFTLGRIYKQEDTYCSSVLKTVDECWDNPSEQVDLSTDGLWAYVAPDGSEHSFFRNATESDEATNAAGETINVYYTADGSMIRGREYVDQDLWELYMPGGEIHVMSHVVGGDIIDEDHSEWELPPPPADPVFCINASWVECTGDWDCPSGVCTSLGHPSCRTHSECGEDHFCSSIPECPPIPPAPNIQPDNSQPDPQTGNYDYDRNKVGYYVEQIRGREEISGQPAAYVDIEYHLPPFDYIPTRITDSHTTASNGREINIEIESLDTGSDDYGHVTAIEYPAPPDESGAATPPTRFTYSYDEIELIFGSVDVLVAVDMPQGYGFRYGYRITGNTTLGYGGELASIDYPSGRRVELTYGLHSRIWRERRSTTNPDECSCAAFQDNTSFIGLAQKEEFIDGDDQNTDPSNYRVWQFSVNSVPETGWEDDGYNNICAFPYSCITESMYWNSVSTMIDPALNVTEIEYDTSTHVFGLPGQNRDPVKPPQELGNFGTAIEERNYRAEVGGNVIVKRSAKVYDVIANNSCHGVSWTAPQQETVTWEDDAEKPQMITTQLVPVFGPGYHHYERTEVSGDAVGDWTKVTERDYLIDNATCANDEGYKSWLPTAVVSASVSVIEAGSETRGALTEQAIDLDTSGHSLGIASGRTTDTVRRLNPGTPGTCYTSLSDFSLSDGDSVTHIGHDTAGNVNYEGVRLHPAGADEFSTSTVFEYGVPAQSKNDAVPFYSTIATVDPGTSLTVAEEVGGAAPGDPKAVSYSYVFDELRRPVMERIGNVMEPWRIDYLNTALPDGRNRLDRVVTRQGTPGSEDEIKKTDFYDTVGRKITTEQLLPQGGTGYQHTRYDPAGQVEFVSESSYFSDPNHASLVGTTFDYTTDGDGDPTTGPRDPFGRSWRTTGPLGEVTETVYFGTNKTVTAHDMAGGQSAETPFDVATTYYTDGLGRLRAVETSAPNTTGAEADYGYDHADRLIRVQLVDDVAIVPSGSDRWAATLTAGTYGSAQERTFTYDALGRQTTATHPENGTTTTIAWNALGSPLEVQDAGGALGGYVHRIEYDAAGRPFENRRTLVAGENSLDVAFGAGDTQLIADDFNTDHGLGCTEIDGWYIGNNQCKYAKNGALTATLTLPDSIAIPSAGGASFSFEFWRQVRNDASAGGSRDRLRVLVKEQNESWPDAAEVYSIDSTQISWSRLKRSPAIPLNDFNGQLVDVRIQFESVDKNTIQTLKGIVIGEIAVRRPANTLLTRTTYDEDFGISTNKANGQMTTVEVLDDSTGTVAWKREFVYDQPEGRVSDESINVDWDRTGNLVQFETDYDYTTLGQLQSQTLPHHSGETARTYSYRFRHGALVALDGAIAGEQPQEFLKDTSIGQPGIEYDLAGGMRRIRYGNGLQGHMNVNGAFLPTKIWVDDGGAPSLFDTGTYHYDGARNIKQIGADTFRYDAAGRLDWASMSSTLYGGRQIDYTYDIYGNMTERVLNASGPAGMDFSGRAHAGNDNRISNTDFEYDANGNLTKEPDHDGITGHRYRFNAENRMTLAQGLSGGKIYQESRYDPPGHRWMRAVAGESGAVLVSLRDAAGQVAADFVADNPAASPELQPTKEYVRANGKLLAVNSPCGPRPNLMLDDPMLDGGEYRFIKDTFGVVATGDHTIIIETPNGLRNTLDEDSTLADAFGLPKAHFFPGKLNKVWIQLEAECGQTGYSNAVSINVPSGGGGNPPPDPPPCVRDVGLSRSFGGPAPSISFTGITGSCSGGTVFHVDYIPSGSTEITRLTQYPRPFPRFDLVGMSPSAGHGQYFFVPVDPVTLEEGEPSPPVEDDADTSGGGQPPGEPSVNARYMHWDHLGSTRLITDEKGETLGKYKFYPFGHEAEVSGGGDNRMKFTGHERDDGLGLDYMLARYSGPRFGTFVSADPLEIVAFQGGNDVQKKSFRGHIGNPKTWNKYSYVWGNPLSHTDPTGLDAVIEIDPSSTKTVTDSKGHQHTLYEATVFLDTTVSEHAAGKTSGKTTATVFVGITAESSTAKKSKSKTGAASEPHGTNMDTPPGKFRVTKSVGKKGGPRGWLAISDPGGPSGQIKHRSVTRVGMSIHAGFPCGSEGCISSPDFATLKAAVQPDIKAGRPVHIIVPNIHSSP